MKLYKWHPLAIPSAPFVACAFVLFNVVCCYCYFCPLLGNFLIHGIHDYSSYCSESQREAALLLGQFASTDSDCKVEQNNILFIKIWGLLNSITSYLILVLAKRALNGVSVGAHSSKRCFATTNTNAPVTWYSIEGNVSLRAREVSSGNIICFFVPLVCAFWINLDF